MKHLIFIITILSFNLNLFSQSIEFKKDKVLVDKELYCYMEKGGNFFSVWTYTVKNLNNEELMFLKSNRVEITERDLRIYYTVTITETEEVFEIEDFISFKTSFIKSLIKYEVIKNNKINPEGLKNYKRTYADNFGEKFEREADRKAATTTINIYNNSNNKEDYYIVDRDKTANLFIINGKVTQDFEQIATFKVKEEEINGEDFDVFYIYNSKNRLIAKCFTDNFEKSIKIFVVITRVEYLAESKSILDSHKAEIIIKRLIDLSYI